MLQMRAPQRSLHELNMEMSVIQKTVVLKNIFFAGASAPSHRLRPGRSPALPVAKNGPAYNKTHRHILYSPCSVVTTDIKTAKQMNVPQRGPFITLHLPLYLSATQHDVAQAHAQIDPQWCSSTSPFALDEKSALLIRSAYKSFQQVNSLC